MKYILLNRILKIKFGETFFSNHQKRKFKRLDEPNAAKSTSINRIDKLLYIFLLVKIINFTSWNGLVKNARSSVARNRSLYYAIINKVLKFHVVHFLEIFTSIFIYI